MRILIAAMAAAGLMTAAAQAQTPVPAPAQSSPQNAAVKPPMQNNAPGPVAGANSFTEAQARSHIESKGYSQVSGLQKDANGIWRGRALKGGQQVAVSLDYQGNVH